MQLVEGQRLRGIRFRSRVLLCQTEKQGASIAPLAGCTQIEAEFSNTANTVLGGESLRVCDKLGCGMQDAECDHSRAAVLTDMQQEWTDNEFTQCVEFALGCLPRGFVLNGATLPNFPEELLNV